MSHGTDSLVFHVLSPQQGFFSGIGGGFYNRGDIVVDGESYFSLNEASVSWLLVVVMVVVGLIPGVHRGGNGEHEAFPPS